MIEDSSFEFLVLRIRVFKIQVFHSASGELTLEIVECVRNTPQILQGEYTLFLRLVLQKVIPFWQVLKLVATQVKRGTEGRGI